MRTGGEGEGEGGVTIFGDHGQSVIALTRIGSHCGCLDHQNHMHLPRRNGCGAVESIPIDEHNNNNVISNVSLSRVIGKQQSRRKRRRKKKKKRENTKEKN